MFGKTRRDCCNVIAYMALVMVDYICTRCEDLLCQAEEEQNENIKVFNYDQVREQMSMLLGKAKSEISCAMVVSDGKSLC